MGISCKSHEKKSDKECQSPMLKIFKDMMQRNEEPEKTKLLKQKDDRKKKKKNSTTRVKSGEIIEQKFHFDSRSSVSEGYIPKIKMVDDKTFEKEYSQCRTKCYPFRGEKKENWWFCNDKSKSEDTCSCVSCALQNLFNTQCLGICCLISVFVVSVVFAFYLVFRTSMAYPMTDNMDETMKLKKDTNFGSRFSRNRNLYNIKDFNGLSGYVGPDATDSFRENRNSEDSDSALNELTSVLNNNNNNMKNDPNSETLRNFYKKIVQTDAQIQLLKKANQYNMAETGGDMYASRRLKRSIKLNNKNHQNRGDLVRKQINKREVGAFINERGKRNDAEPTGFVIERKKFIVQYNPAEIKHKVPKCSHAPKEQKSHEKQLKHPFYKNTQRLDELLDKLIEHNVHYEVADPVFLEKLLKDSEPDERRKMEKSDADGSFFGVNPAIKNVEVTTKATQGIEDTTLFDMKKMMSSYGDLEGDQVKLTTPLDFDGVLSGSTLMNHIGNVPTGAEVVETAPNMRKLMQFDDGNDEEHDEEKFFDYGETQDDKEQDDSRKKRMDYETDNYTPKHKVPNLYNANWKGPMPLYPDEINILIKQAAMQNLNVELPKHAADTTERDRTYDEDEVRLSDTEYIDDNENKRYERMAQAYSDYGVLDSKRESTESNKEDEVTIKNLNFAMNKKMNPGLDRLKKDYNSDKESNSGKGNEGFKFGISKTGDAEDKSFEIMHQLKKHIKVVHDYSKPHASSQNLPLDATPSVESGDSNNVYNLGAIKRSLKSLDTDKVGTEVDNAYEEKNDEDVKILSHIFGQVKTMRDFNLKNDSNETGMNVNNNNKTEYYAADIGPGEFLTMISTWFQTFSAFLLNKNSLDVSKLSSNTTTNASNVAGELKTKESVYFPTYDADMIENIGHRSRVLLSLDELKNASVKEVSERDNKKFSSGHNEEINAAKNAVSIKSATNSINSHSTERHGNISTNEFILFSRNRSNPIENRTVVKRDVEANNNFIFWNDMYDDEYGVRTDPIDTSIRDKHSTNSSDVLKKSHRWFERKIKILSDIIRKPKKPRNVDPRFGKGRRARDIFRKEHDGLDFRSLTDNMKEVCREAMQAMKSTRNVEVRENNKEYAVASSLMQQLVKLMSDLVDYQVQQKTCQKLPPDLHSFLEWLVVENDERDVPPKAELQFPAIDDLNLDATTIRDASNDDFRYRDALKTVQDLIKQYEGFSDADKDKMTGVREYLQNQLEYLQGQVAFGGDSMSSLYVNPYLPIRDRRKSLKKRNAKNILQKYIKYFDGASKRPSTIQDGGSVFTSHSNLESTTRKL